MKWFCFTITFDGEATAEGEVIEEYVEDRRRPSSMPLIVQTTVNLPGLLLREWMQQPTKNDSRMWHYMLLVREDYLIL